MSKSKRGRFEERYLRLAEYDGKCQICDRRLLFSYEHYQYEAVVDKMPALCRCGQLSVIPLRLGYFESRQGAYSGIYSNGSWVIHRKAPPK